MILWHSLCLKNNFASVLFFLFFQKCLLLSLNKQLNTNCSLCSFFICVCKCLIALRHLFKSCIKVHSKYQALTHHRSLYARVSWPSFIYLSTNHQTCKLQPFCGPFKCFFGVCPQCASLNGKMSEVLLLQMKCAQTNHFSPKKFNKTVFI